MLMCDYERENPLTEKDEYAFFHVPVADTAASTTKFLMTDRFTWVSF